MKLAIAMQVSPWAEDRYRMAVKLEDRLTYDIVDFRNGWATERLHVEYIGMIPDLGTKERPGGVWATNKRAWLQMREAVPDATHHLVLQDDMKLAPGFFGNLLRALGAAPGRVLCLLCHRATMDKALEIGATFIAMPDGTWGGSTLFPRAKLDEFLAWDEANITDGCPLDDMRFDLWLRGTKQTALATVPSLIDHIGERSLIGHAKGRQARHLSDGSVIKFNIEPTPPRSGKALNRKVFTYLKERP